jgi:probable addiction module antidote protein
VRDNFFDRPLEERRAELENRLAQALAARKAKGKWPTMRGKRETPSERAFAAKHCDNPRAIAKYLNGALATGDSVLITKAIGDMVRAQGVTRVSRRAHMRRDNLYRAFKGELKPAFDKVIKVLIALDIQLVAKPSAGLGVRQ